MYNQKNGHRGRCTDKCTNRRRDNWAHIQMYKHTNGDTDRCTHIKMETQIDVQTDK